MGKAREWPPARRNASASDRLFKGEHQHRPKAYHDDAATRFLQQLRDQDAATRAALTTNDKLTEAEKQQAEFLQKIADLKERKILTVDEKSLLAAQDRIKAQFAINVEHERELKLKQDIQKLDERAAQIRAQIGNYQRGQGEQHQRQLDAFGMGSEALAQVQAMKSIYSEYERMQWQLEKETPKSARGSQQYLEAQADIKAGLNQSLQDFDNYYAALKAKQDDWTNGAATAFANYVDSAHNAAAQAQEAVTRTIKGMEDAMVEFVTTGKVSFAKLADGILADLSRMATRGIMSKFVENASSMGGQLAGGLFAAHPDVAAKAANMLPGDPLESLMKLTKGFGTMGAQILPKAIGSMGAATQNTAALNAANATVATMTVGTLIGGFGAGSGGGIGGLGGLLGSLGQGDMAGAFGFTATGVTGSVDAVATGAMLAPDTSGMSALMGVGFRASGGAVTAGMPYIVGEQGRELFVPSQQGTIVPNHALLSRDDASSATGRGVSNSVFNMNISVPPGTTRATAQQQGRAIMESAAIAQRRNG
ncbi:TPA: phage tail tape measure protein [Burkholderia multivorans]|uniref:phage tail tape measure protein n=3 Tax=Burkholderia multivorans TaxID=87883 RepID=UPI00158FA262|nr:phage tail tape measure protein [Burkholderia multivorans]MBU9239865.1 phage tail tape measure protein [Burkholderia multivorans]MBU9650024.1 phage tail tape measure protein [Burkholderia multivorans]HEF4748864.1 phage tail tape measure protein [Burkholderia multivorans]